MTIFTLKIENRKSLRKLIIICALQAFATFLPYLVHAQGMTLHLTPSVYGESSNTQCFGTATGSVNLEVTGGTSPYTYEWTNNATTQNITNIAAGYYGVKVTDANNNVQFANII